MEFASELLITALKHQAKLLEVPSGLRRDLRDRPPHLRRWRDGMRHLLFIYSGNPTFFEWLGLILILLFSALQLGAYFWGPREVFGLHIFEIHSKLILIMFAAFGMQFYIYALYCHALANEPSTRLTKWLININEAPLFFLILITSLLEILGIMYVFIRWAQSDFARLGMQGGLILWVHFSILVGFLLIGLLGVHMLKRVIHRRIHTVHKA